MVQAQMPVKKTLNPFISNSQELKVEKRSLETDLPELVINMNWDEDNGDWIVLDTTLNKYSNNGWLLEETKLRSWGQYKSIYTYDGAGRELTRLSLDYIDANRRWDTSGLYRTTYDANGLTIKSLDKYNWNGSNWEDSSMRRYTNKVDSKGRITEQIQERWSMADGYEYVSKTLYAYGIDNKINRLELQGWSDSLNAFEQMVVYDSIVWYQYVENDAFLEKSKPLYVSGISSMDEMKNFITITWSYDKKDNIIEQTMLNEDESGDGVLERERYEYKYDSEGRCIEALYFYGEGEKDNIPESRTIYAKFYTAPNLATQKLVTNEKVYPNPAVDYIFLKEKVTELELLNMQGQQQLSIKFLEADVPFDVSSLTAGTYILRYRNQEGLLSTSQLLIQ
ncbi:T9SS type A sorting domain-containing protein [Bacteroidia bacterium]|nr:T9SS type A sorting domain-containing protein [Bacteroidia bacterium]